MGLVTRQHKICNLKPDKHVNFLASLPDGLILLPAHSFSFNLFICPSSVTNVELNMLKEREKKKKAKKNGERRACVCSLHVSSQEEVQKLALY